MPRPGMVELTPSSGPKLTLILNAEPERTFGVGGYEASERLMRRPAKWYKQIPDDTMVLDCTLDIDAIGGPSIERRIEVLRDMGLAGSNASPPTITLDGDVWENDKSLEWVIQDQGLTLGPRLWNPDGTLRRQQVSISLERMNDSTDIEPTQQTSTRSGARRRRHVAVTKVGDTLRAVALRELGDSTRWKDIKSWNKTRLRKVDPDVILRTGTHLTIR
jgi:phage protein U